MPVNQPPPFSSSRAYLIGISNYRHAPWQLKTPVDDARAMQTLLGERHGFNTTLLADPTAEQLRALFHQIQLENTGDDGRVLIYYAGHGVQRDSANGLQGYFVPADARPGADDSMVSMELLADTLRQVKSRHLLLVLDCCFAGMFRVPGRRDIGFDRADTPIMRQHYEIFCSFPSRLVLSSTSYRQKAYDRIEDADANSPFNRFLRQAIEGDADYTRDRLVTATELKTYLTDNLSLITGYTGNLQSVGLDALDGDGEGEFLFFLDGFDATRLPKQAYVNPYKGLQSYEPDDAALFFGRRKATRVLLAKAKVCPFVIVAGASGTGKSSLVKAGLLPGLQQEGLSRARTAVIRPGKNPLKALPPEQQWDLLVVDQWEEVITQAQDPQEVEQFYATIRRLLDSGKRIVGTVRADFEAQARHEALEPYWTPGRFVAPPFTSEEYHDVIVQPAKRVACLFEDRELVQQIEQEVAQQPGPLPLLSFMLSELFERAKSETARYREIKRKHYEDVGGVSGALRNKAEEVYAQLPDDAHRDTMRRLMLRMVSFSAGEMAGRRVLMEDLNFGPAQKPLTDAVVTALADSRLIRNTTARAEQDEQDKKRTAEQAATDDNRPFIEPAHDALVRAWKRLWDWVRELGEENLLLHAKLITAVTDYRASQRKEEFLWTTDPRLEQAKALMKQDPLLLNAAEKDFVEAGLAARDRRAKRRRNELIGAFSLLSLLLVGAIFFAVLSNQNATRANQKTIEAEKNLADFLRADSTRLAEEAAKERLNFDRYVREGDTYMASFDYDLALSRYVKADSLYLRFPKDMDLVQKIAEVRGKMEEAKKAVSGNQK